MDKEIAFYLAKLSNNLSANIHCVEEFLSKTLNLLLL